jgi:hypothetical protein
MSEIPSLDELRKRIQREIDFYGGTMQERSALAWAGYLAALIEWGLISVADHERLCKMLPRIEDNPAVQILLGREN